MSSDHPRLQAETGGALAAIGVASLLWALIEALVLFSTLGDRGANVLGLGIPLLPRLLLGLLALRAGRRVTAGAAGTAVGTYVVGSILVSVGLSFLGALTMIGTMDWWMVIWMIPIAASLDVPVLVWMYARPRGALVQRNAPDAAAAAKPLMWITLWFGIELGSHVVFLAFRESPRAIEWAGLALAAVLIALDLAAFFSCYRGAARRTMWVSAIGGVVALALLAATWLVFGETQRQVMNVAGWPLAAQAATLFVLARLHRPSAREERGVEDVFT